MQVGLDAVDHPAHYTAHYRREVIELTSRLDFASGNAVKYVLRSRFKGKAQEDLRKAQWYIAFLREHPDAGHLRDGQDIDAVVADFAADLLAAPAGGFGPRAARFICAMALALRADGHARDGLLAHAGEDVERLVKAASKEHPPRPA